MKKGTDILATATRDIGYHEGTGKHNKYGEWFGLDYVDWCMEAVQYWYYYSGLPLPYKTPSCGSLLNWYRENKPECITKNPIPGCIVIFDWPNTKYATDHTGIFVSATKTKITTVDGNTGGPDGSRSGWVQQVTRDLSYANPTYIIPIGLEDDMNIDDLSPKDCYEIMRKANEYAATLPVPKWMKDDLESAVKAGITDGTRPMAFSTRGESAIMALRDDTNGDV